MNDIIRQTDDWIYQHVINYQCGFWWFAELIRQQQQWNLIIQCQTFIITSINFMVFLVNKSSCKNSFPKLFMHPKTFALPYVHVLAVSTDGSVKEQNQVNIINILTCWSSFLCSLNFIQFSTNMRLWQVQTAKKSFVCEKICLRTLIIILAM